MDNINDYPLTKGDIESHETEATIACMTTPIKTQIYCIEMPQAAKVVASIDPLAAAPLLRLDSEQIQEDLMEEIHNESHYDSLHSHNYSDHDLPFNFDLDTAISGNHQDSVNKQNGAIEHGSHDPHRDEVYSDASDAENMKHILDLFTNPEKAYHRNVLERIECYSDYVPESSIIQLATRCDDTQVEQCYHNKALSSSEVVLGTCDAEISSANASDPGTYQDCMTKLPLATDNEHSSPCVSLDEATFHGLVSQPANTIEFIEPQAEEGAILMPQSRNKISRSSEDSALNRVMEWINNIQPYDMIPPEEGSTAWNLERSAKHEIANTEYTITNAAVRSLHPLSTVAHISGVGLQEVPSLGMFSCLKTLNLSANLIVRVPIGSLPRSLHSLDLSRNRITQIEGFRELTRLRDLNLSYNRIMRIGHGLSNCTHVRQLNLAGNKISEVEGLQRLLKLSVLDLGCNKLSSSKDLGQLAANYRSLLVVNIIGNPVVASLGDDAIKKLVMSLLPYVMYLNNQPIKAGPLRDTAIDSVVKTVLGISHPMTKSTDRKHAKKIVSGAHKPPKILDQRLASDTGGSRRDHYPPRYRQHSHS